MADDDRIALPAWAAALPPVPPPPPQRFPWSTHEDYQAGSHPDELRLAGVEGVLSYAFRDRRLLRCALTSRAWVHENQFQGWADNKALEWLGDAVLYMAVTERLVMADEALQTGTATPHRVGLISNEKLA